MNAQGITMMVWVLLAGWVSTGWAQAPSAEKATDKAAATKVDTAPAAQTRAELHRTMAELIEAQAAAQPDQAKIKALTDKLQELRGKIGGPAANVPRGPMAGGRGPWGGPGMGAGMGRGPGRGMGPGYGRGPGWGRGPGGGAGRGGWGPGPGFGAGRGPGFVDADRDGVCDNFERAWGHR
jgi:hypothetical protein